LPEGPEIRVSFDGHRSLDLAALLPAVFLYLELPHSVKCSNVKSAADECDHNAGPFATAAWPPSGKSLLPELGGRQ
jgi:hypothetical protein